MAKGSYVGISGGARNVKETYVGVAGVARKVKEIYVGVGGVPKLAWRGTVPAGQVVFTSSRTWKIPDGVKTIEVFLVGGGGGGPISSSYSYGAPGAAGGFTKTYTISGLSGQTATISIGAGGEGNWMGNMSGQGRTGYGNAGNDSTFVVNGATYIAKGAGEAKFQSTGQGGSGGGMTGYLPSEYSGARSGGHGGSDGSNGKNSSGKIQTYSYPGQGSTTRAFGESTGTLYAGGGGGQGGYNNSNYHGQGGTGGAGGGGNGGSAPLGSGFTDTYATAGAPNTGGGAGGGGIRGNVQYSNIGGSGIVIVRWKEQ